MCAHLVKPKTYSVISDHCELPRNSRFQIARRPIKDGQLVLAQINGHHIVGRRFQLDGHSWIHHYALKSIMVIELTALSGNDFDVGEISAHSAASPEADQPFLAVAQLSDD
jgi:hypothetical protein